MKINKAMFIFPAVLLIYLVTRLINLTIIPIFADEAIYIRWSQILGEDLNQLFIPLTDGKQPLFMWLAAPFLKFISDPLWTGRFVSVVSGAFGLLGVWLATREIFNNKTALIAIILYLFTPFILFYNRLSVPDDLLSTFGVWSLYFSILLIRRLKLKYAFLLGLFLGLSWLTKSPGQFYFFLAPFAILLFNFRQKFFFKSIMKILIFWLLAFGMGFFIYNLLRVSPYFYIIEQRSRDFVFSFREALVHPLDPLMFRPAEIFGWFWNYLTPPILILGLFACGVYLYKLSRKDLILIAWFFGPLIVESEFAKGFTARYIIFTIPPFLIILAHFISEFSEVLKNKIQTTLYYLILIIFMVPAIIFNYYLLTNPQKAEIPQKERSGYLEEWSAGHGIKEIADFIKEKAKNNKVLVGTEGTFGTLPDGLQIYTRGIKNLTVSGMGQMAAIYYIPPSLIEFAKNTGLAYLVVNNDRLMATKDPHLKLLKEYPKAQGPAPREYLQFYEIQFIPGLDK